LVHLDCACPPASILHIMGSGASAPHLKEYFAEKQKFQDSDPAEGLAMAMMMGGEEAPAAMGKEKKWFDETGKAILEKSFDHHDKDKSKKLEKAEAEKFFANLIQEEETFTAAMAEAGIRAAMQGMMGMSMGMAAMFGGDEDAKKMKAEMKKAEKEMKKQIDAAVAAAKKDAAQRRKNYKAQKKEFDEAAFKVMDTNGDGSIVLDEFLTFFDPATEKHDELLVALGFMTEQERQQKLAMKGMKAGGPEGEECCVM